MDQGFVILHTHGFRDVDSCRFWMSAILDVEPFDAQIRTYRRCDFHNGRQNIADVLEPQ